MTDCEDDRHWAQPFGSAIEELFMTRAMAVEHVYRLAKASGQPVQLLAGSPSRLRTILMVDPRR